ncbi:NUDIX hydrolase 6-like protein [Tanacetum coccineum]
MSKTRAGYRSGIVRPNIKDKDSFELKGQFLKELRDNIFSGSDHEDENEHIKKVLEIVDLFHIPNITIDQVMLRAFPKLDENLYQAWERFKDLLMKCPQHYLTEMQEVVLFYNGLDVPTRQILDSRGAIPSKTNADAKVAIQEMAEYSQKWHNGTSRTKSIETSDGLSAIQAQLNNLRREIKKVNEKVYVAQVGCRQCKGEGYRATSPRFYQRNNENPSHEENSNLIKEIRASTDDAIMNQGASIKTLDIQIGQMRKVLHERGFGSLPSSTETNPRDHFKSILTIFEAHSYPIRRMRSSEYAKGSYGPQFLEAYSYGASDNSIPRKDEDPGSFTLPCFINNVCFNNALADLGASVCFMPFSTYLNLGLGELAHTKLTVELADRIVKYPKRIAENMLVGIGKFVFPVDFIILDMPEDIKVPLILERPFCLPPMLRLMFSKGRLL